MDIGIQVLSNASEDLVHYLLRRDAALWIGEGSDSNTHTIEALARLVGLPWKLVLCEANSKPLAQAFTAMAKEPNDRLASQRGFINIISGNPEDLLLPPRTLPVYLLNGRADATDREETPSPGRQSAARRRANMIGRLLDSKPQLLVIVSVGPASPLRDVRELWHEEGFRAHVAVLGNSADITDQLNKWLAEPNHPPAAQHYTATLPAFVDDLVSRVESRVSDSQLAIRLRWDGAVRALDVTEAELVEQPVLDRYDLIQDRDVHGLLPQELSDEALESFFDKSAFTERTADRWAPFAAGVPWPRFPHAIDTLLRTLEEVETCGPDHNELLLLPSEPGAGGTTAAKALAFEAAKSGYPTLVATPAYFRPDLTELSRFLLRVRQQQLRVASAGDKVEQLDDGRLGETPWLIVFDVHHWRGKQQDLAAFVRRLSQERRPAVVLSVVESASMAEASSHENVICDTLTHELTSDEAKHLGEHLNKFLRHKNRDRSEAEWHAFWDSHRPRVGTFGASSAAFWVALEFFLKRQLDLAQPIQAWIYKQFKDVVIPTGLRRMLLEIAALAVERQPYPEQLLPSAAGDEYPYSVQLEDLRSAVPALALARYTTATEKQWAIAHDLLARYLLHATFADRPMLESLGLGSVTDPVSLRLLLLKSVATRSELSRKRYLPLALEFAVNILKLDRDGNREFFGHWREVLGILEDMPEEVWNTSRTFNHHVAISRRRVVRDEQLFELSPQEKREQLELAIEHLKYALSLLVTEETDERDLYLYNSLARAYQDLAEIERVTGADEIKLRALSELATEAARKAYDEDPQNPYVLETYARDMIQQGSVYADKAVANACQALVFIYQALHLESASPRQQQLSLLVEQAVGLLRANTATTEIERLYRKGNAAGYLGKAWLVLMREGEVTQLDDLAHLPKDRLQAALSILNEVPGDQRTWLTLNFQYNLIAASAPYDFDEQINILDELETARFRLNLQQQLERALLLHQCGRHREANDAFRLLRRELRQRDAFVNVPIRLRTLLDRRTGTPLVCEGVIVESGGYRSQARVRDLGGADVRLIPQDFGLNVAKQGFRFKCQIVFGWKGPLAKPLPASSGG